MRAALASIVEGGHVLHVHGIDQHAIFLHQQAQNLELPTAGCRVDCDADRLSMNAAARSLPMVVLALVFDRLLQRRKAEPLGTFSKSQCPDVIFFIHLFTAAMAEGRALSQSRKKLVPSCF